MGKLDINLKVQKKFPEFANEVNGLSVDDLSARISRLAQADADNSEARENDNELAEASARHSELKAPYEDAKKAIKLKSRYLRNLIKEKGGQ
jgi:hypothetical protein